MATQDQAKSVPGKGGKHGKGRVKLQGVRVMEVYTIDLDLQDEGYRKDPAAHVRQVLESEGFEVNGVLISELVRPGGGATPKGGFPGYAHIVHPPTEKSYWIVLN